MSIEGALHTLSQVIASEYSSFYRDLYTKHGKNFGRAFPSAKEWSLVPFLRRSDIQDVSLEKMSFVPQHEICSVACTSGTSGRGIVCVPRLQPEPTETVITRHFSDSYRVMTFFHRYVPLIRWRLSSTGRAFLVAGELKDLKKSARLAHLIGINALHGQATELIIFAHHLARHNIIDDIRFINLLSDMPTLLQLETLQTAYPHALITVWYGHAESGPLVAVVGHTKHHPPRYAPGPWSYIELIREDGSLCTAPGEEGEIVVTTLGRAAFPLIRYRTEDRGAWCTDVPDMFEIRGRMHNNMVRILGGEIILNELERAVLSLEDPNVVDFEASVTEVVRDKKVMPQLRMTIFTLDELHNADNIDISQRLAHTIRVSQHRLYADGVDAGLYMPFTCSFEKLKQAEKRKRQRLVDERLG